MPFTPFHMGPALVVKSIAHRHFSRPVFGVTQVGVDPAALAGHAVTGDLSNHAVPHTLGGATLVAGLVAGLILLLLRPAPDPPFRWWSRLLGARSGSVWRRGAPVPWRAARPSAPLGGWSHVLLDAAIHPELTPLAPFGNANPLHLPLAVARFLTVLRRPAAGLAGAAVLRLRSRRRGDDAGPGVEPQTEPGKSPDPWPTDRWPAVSVVIPARNAAATIGATLDAALAQDYPGPLEVIVGDGSDDDATARVIAARYPAVRRVPNPAGITSAGLNAAIAAARGQVIVRCDAHAVLPPGYVTRALATLRRTGAANVGGRQVPVGRTRFQRAVARAMTSPLGSGDSRYKVGGPAGSVDTVYLGVFRRDALAAVGGFDETIVHNQDYELNWRLRRAGGTVWFDPALAVRYLPRATLPALARQYFNYGRWKNVVLRRHPRSLRLRQLAPPALVLGLALSAGCAALGWLGAAAPVPLAWLGALLAGSVALGIRRRDPAAALLLPAAWATMHLSWGIGFFIPGRSPAGAVPPPPTATAG